MANDINKGKRTEGKGVGVTSSKVNQLPSGNNSMGIPAGQSPGFGHGAKENSFNALPSTARVVKPASSMLMTGMSQNRGSGGNK